MMGSKQCCVPEHPDGLFSFSSRSRRTRSTRDWSSDVCSSDLVQTEGFLPTTHSASQAMTSDPVAGAGIALLPKAKFYPSTNAAWNKVQSAVQSQLGTAMNPSTNPTQVLNSLQQIAQSSG